MLSQLTSESIWHTITAAGTTGVQALDLEIRELYASNRRQWDLEDATRTASSARRIARHKALIDEANLARAGRMSTIDVILHELVVSPDAPPVTESPGSVIDRLTILRIKHDNIRRWMRARDTERDSERGRALGTVEIQLAQLRAALDVLLGDLGSGVRSYLPLPIIKMYGAS